MTVRSDTQTGRGMAVDASPLWERYPLLLLAAAWGAGLWCGWIGHDGAAVLLGSAGVVLLFLAFCCWRYRRGKAAAILLAAAMTGCLTMCLAVPDWYGGKDPLAGTHAMVQGRVASLVYPDSDSVILEDVLLYDETGEATPMEGRIRLWVKETEGSGLQRGAVVLTPMELSVPAASPYPLGLDRRIAAMVQGIRMEGSAGWEGAQVAQPAQSLSWVDRIRYQVAAALRHDFPAEGQALLRALLLGDSSSMEDAQRDTYASLGISHLLAVSGLHVDILLSAAAALPALWRKLRRGKAAVYYNDKQILSFLLLGAFLVLTGWKASIGRAVIMFGMRSVSGYSRRGYSSIQGWAAAFLILTALSPLELFSTGFQLSMASSGAIVLLGSLRGERRGLRCPGPVRITWTVMGSTWPWTLYAFRRLPVLSFLTNLVAIPMVELILVVGLLYALGILLLPWLAAVLFPVLQPLLAFYERLLSLLSGWLPSMTLALREGWAAVLAVGMMASLSPRLLSASRRYRAVTLGGLFLVTAIAVLGPGWPSQISSGDVLCLGGGTQTAVVLRSEDGWAMAGDTPMYQAAEALEAMGAGRLETFYYTGDDPETLREWVETLQDCAVLESVTVSSRLAEAYPSELQALSRRMALPMTVQQEGDAIVWGEYTLTFASFSAKSPGSLLHDALLLESGGSRWIYLDPWRLTGEEAFLEGAQGMIASHWSASRWETVEGLAIPACILADGAQPSAPGRTALYNTNALGALLLRAQDGAARLLPLGGGG